jgi:SAM-dependent methyltransferase
MEGSSGPGPPARGVPSSPSAHGGEPRSLPPEIPDDFRTLDFDRLWRGRDRTTQVESRIVLDALATLSSERVLELGTGDGRLSPFVRRRASEYVGVDQSFEFLLRLRHRLPRTSETLLVEANLYHLPFVAAMAPAALLVRVYNFLTRPGEALREIGRVLVPGGGLLLTCNPRPSTGTLIDDVRRALARRTGERMRSMTFSRADVVPVVPSGIPAVNPTRRFFRRTLREAGLRPAVTYGSGLEDFRWARRLPAQLFLSAGRELGRSPMFPLVWEVARSGPGDGAAALPPLRRSLACPRCRRPFDELDLDHDFEQPCGECGFLLRMESGILRARHVAD